MSEPEQISKRGSRGLRVIQGGPGENVRVLPHSIDAEEQLLACILIDGAASLGLCLRKKLSGRAFYSPANRLVFDTLCAMQAAGKPIDLAVLAEELKTTRQLDEIGGYAFLTQVTNRVTTTVQASYFVEKLQELSVLRELIREFNAGLDDCFAYQGGLEDFVSRKALKLQRWADLISGLNRESLGDRLTKRLDMTLAAAAGKVDKTRWIHWGLPWVDSCIKPLDTKAEDWLNVVGGPPSGGKSSWLRMVAVHNLDSDKRVAVFLLETGLRWVEAAAATKARVNLRSLETADATKDMVARYETAYRGLQTYADKTMFVYEDLIFVEDIERQVRELNRTLRERDIAAGVPENQARGLDLVVVDYLQLIATRENFRGQREQVVAHISRTLKRLFKGLDIVGLVGAQINRGSREDPAKPPALSALRESGAIEQDADRVIFVFTPPTNLAGLIQDGNNITDEVDIIQRKSRNGPRDVSVGVLFHKTQTRYEDVIRRGDVRPGLPKPETGYKRSGGGL
jgi:replicative DNA helicase